VWHAAAASVFAIVCCGCSSAAFDPMPPDANNLTPALGPVTGTGSTTFTVTATRSMSLTMGCIGTGILTVLGPLSGEVMCDGPSLGRGTFAGYYWSHLRARPGERLRLRILLTRRWRGISASTACLATAKAMRARTASVLSIMECQASSGT
jgi:hypothetical protein